MRLWSDENQTLSTLLAARLHFFLRTDFRPEPDQFDPHRDDLVGERSLWIRTEIVAAPKTLNGTLNFRQATRD